MTKRAQIVLAGSILAVGALMGADLRTRAAAGVSLHLDGKYACPLKSVEGGAIVGVVAEDAAGGGLVHKQLVGVKVQEFTIQLNPVGEPLVFAWIQSLLDLKPQRQNGSIVASDGLSNATHERQFTNGILTEVSFPALDGSIKEAAYLTLKIAPETIREVKGGKEPQPPAAGGKMKQLLSSNFHLEIDGLDCTRVSRIEGLRVQQEPGGGIARGVGIVRGEIKSGLVRTSNFKVTLTEASAESWRKWHEDFVVQGNHNDGQERKGFLLILEPDLKTVAMRLVFSHLGIISVIPVGEGGATDKIGKVEAELYCEQLQLLPQ